MGDSNVVRYLREILDRPGKPGVRHVAAEALSQLVLDEADDAAYRRVCERKGLLPL